MFGDVEVGDERMHSRASPARGAHHHYSSAAPLAPLLTLSLKLSRVIAVAFARIPDTL